MRNPFRFFNCPVPFASLLPAHKSPTTWFLAACISLFFSACSQAKPKEPDAVNRYDIYCAAEDFDRIYTDWKTESYISVVLKYKGETYQHLKMRLRGDSSREYDKKSLKIKPDGALLPDGKSSINLNAEYKDKSMIRQALASNLFQRSGQTCFNTQFAEVYLNDKFLGLYLEVENMDELFLKRNGLNPEGNLYKATKDGASMSIFDDFDAKWENKTRKKRKFADLANLVHNLNTIPDDEFYDYVKLTFNYEALVNMLAINMYIANGSTYYHNYYLFHDWTESGKWFMLPWDLDKTIHYYHWQPYTYHETSSYWESDNPLVERSIMNPNILADIRARLNELSNSSFSANAVNHLVDSLGQVVAPLVFKDSTNKVNNENEWKNQLKKEKEFLANHKAQLFRQMDEQPKPFKVNRITETVIDSALFSWSSSSSGSQKTITYSLRYGLDFLLPDSTSTIIDQLTDTLFVAHNFEPNKTYYWRVSASDGEFKTDGYNTKNIFQTAAPTVLSGTISHSMTLSPEGSPYFIASDLTIKPGAILKALPGTEILINKDVDILISGGLLFEGTKENPVVMAPKLASAPWGNLNFFGSSDTVAMRNVELREGRISAANVNLALENCHFEIDQKMLTYQRDDELIRESWLWSNECNIVFNGNQLIGNGSGEGLNLFYSKCQVIGNKIINCPDAIELIGCYDSEILYNWVDRCPDDAIDMNACHNMVVKHNLLTNIFDKGISVGSEQYGYSENIQITNNIVYGAKYGVGLKDSSFADIGSNIFSNCTYGVRLYQKQGKYEQGGTATVTDNVFHQCDKNLEVDQHSSFTGDEGIEVSLEADLSSFMHGDFQIADTYFPGEMGGKSFQWLEARDRIQIQQTNYEKCCGLQLTNPNAYPVYLGGYQILSSESSIFSFPRTYMIDAHQTVLVGKCKKHYVPSGVIFLDWEVICDKDLSSENIKLSKSIY